MARSNAQSYPKTLSQINNLFRLATPLVGREQAATLVLWLFTPGCGAEPHGVPSLATDSSAERTTTPETILSNIRGILPPDLALEIARWDRWKKRTIAALLATKRGNSRSDDKKKFNPMRLASRINLCGSSVLVMSANTSFTEPTLALPARCNNAACPHCSRLISAERSEAVLEALQSKNPSDLRMMTLTVPNCPRGALSRATRALHEAFRTLRDSKGRAHWPDFVKGYVWNLEISLNQRDGTWHPHIHVLYEGNYWPEKDLKAAWLCAQRAHGFEPKDKYPGVWLERLYYKTPTGEKRPVETSGELYAAAREISKYNLKPLEAGEIRHDDTVELLESLFNMRRFGANGTLAINTEKKAAERVRKILGSQADWEMLGGFEKVEKEGLCSDDSEFYARTLEQLEHDPSALAAVLRKNEKLSFVAEASCKTESTKQ